MQQNAVDTKTKFLQLERETKNSFLKVNNYLKDVQGNLGAARQKQNQLEKQLKDIKAQSEKQMKEMKTQFEKQINDQNESIEEKFSRMFKYQEQINEKLTAMDKNQQETTKDIKS